MVTKEEYEKAFKVIYTYQNQIRAEILKLKDEDNLISKLQIRGEDRLVFHCSVRLFNAVRNLLGLGYPINSTDILVNDLSKVSISELNSQRNAGKVALNELIEISCRAGITLLK